MPTELPPRHTPRHAAADDYQGRHRAEPRHRTESSGHARQRWATACVLCCLSVGAVWALSARTAPPEPGAAVGAGQYTTEASAERDAAERPASRSSSRAGAEATTTPATTPATTRPATTAKPTTPAATRTATPTPTTQGPPEPVADLTQAQMNNAQTVVRIGQQLDMPTEALVVAIATCMQESDLRNLANDYVPESFDYPHEGSGADHDSVGLFQQRPSTGWGTVAQIMTPTYAATKFYEALREVSGWQSMSIAEAAQAVQVSAFPDAYAKHESRARTIVAALI